MSSNITVLFPVFERDDIQKTLASLQSQTYPDFSVMIIDNSLSDSEQYESYVRADRRFEAVKLSKPLGSCGSFLTGLRKCNTDYVLMLDTPVILHEQFLEKAVAELESNATCSAVISTSISNKNSSVFDIQSDFDAVQRYIALLTNMVHEGPVTALLRHSAIQSVSLRPVFQSAIIPLCHAAGNGTVRLLDVQTMLPESSKLNEIQQMERITGTVQYPSYELLLLSFIKDIRNHPAFSDEEKNIVLMITVKILESAFPVYQEFDENRIAPVISKSVDLPFIKEDESLFLYAGDVPYLPQYRHYLGLSIKQNDERHISHDITQRHPFKDNSVSIYQAEDVFEHIEYDDIPDIIDDIYRILKPGGIFRLSVPDYTFPLFHERVKRDDAGNIVFDPFGGGDFIDGKVVEGGHVWFPDYRQVKAILEKTKFSDIRFYHYYDESGEPVLNPIDYSLGFVQRTPDHDERGQNPRLPMSLVVDCVKEK